MQNFFIFFEQSNSCYHQELLDTLAPGYLLGTITKGKREMENGD